MTYTYTTNNTTANSGTITLNSGASYSTPITITNLSAGGSSGQVFTTTSNGTSWVSTNTNFTSSNHKTIMTIPYGEEKVVLEKEATLEVKGNVVINGVDLEERLRTIEKILTIPERDVKLENKYPKLKRLYDEYIKTLGKYRTFEAIKGDEE